MWGIISNHGKKEKVGLLEGEEGKCINEQSVVSIAHYPEPTSGVSRVP